MNEARQRLIEFCEENAPVIANTLFQQHKRTLCTWTSSDGQYWNQIDYILCSQRWKSSIPSAKTRPGDDCGSDHELLIAKFRLKLKKVILPRPFRYDLNQIPWFYSRSNIQEIRQATEVVKPKGLWNMGIQIQVSNVKRCSHFQFSRSVVSDSLRPHDSQHARPPCASPTPGVHSDSRPSSQWCHPAISSLVVPFSCPQSLPASESFPMSQLFAWGGQSTGVSALASFLSGCQLPDSQNSLYSSVCSKGRGNTKE